MNRLQRALNAIVERVDTPAPIVLLDVMKRNIEGMQSFATEQSVQLRRGTWR